MNGYIYQSVLTNNKIIIIEINLNYYSNNKTTKEQLNNDIKEEIENAYKLEPTSKNLNEYIQLENNLLMYPEQYNLISTELVNRKILVETQNNKIIDIKKETSNNESEEINRLKKELNDERNKNKNLEEQINIEKNKNKIMEEKLTNLRN